MSKNIIIRLKKAGNRTSVFSIYDSIGNILTPSVTKNQLISGIAFTVEDSVVFITIKSIGINCCSKELRVPITTITRPELAAMEFTPSNTSSTWTHLTTSNLYNNFYGCKSSYVIEYPFAYQYQDELIQNVKDYTKSYIFLTNSIFNITNKIQTNEYFNKAIVYNDQQSSGILNLFSKPLNNLRAYNLYPKYNTDSKDITFTKSDNFYQYNTFWALEKDKQIPLFLQSCVSLSIDKEVNQENMDYSSRSFRKAPIRAKDVKIRHILDNRSDLLLVTQFVINQSQISF